MNVEEAFEKLVDGEIESFVVQDAGSWRVRVDRETLLGGAQMVMDKPKTEEVGVKTFAVVDGNGKVLFVTKSESTAISHHCDGRHIISMTGHHTRPIPKKIKKRVEIGEVIHGTITFTANHSLPVGTKLFAEYEEEA